MLRQRRGPAVLNAYLFSPEHPKLHGGPENISTSTWISKPGNSGGMGPRLGARFTQCGYYESCKASVQTMKATISIPFLVMSRWMLVRSCQDGRQPPSIKGRVFCCSSPHITYNKHTTNRSPFPEYTSPCITYFKQNFPKELSPWHHPPNLNLSRPSGATSQHTQPTERLPGTLPSPSRSRPSVTGASPCTHPL